MKCLVTGSEGFIGKNLVARLEQEGHEVVGLDCGYGLDYKEEGDFLRWSSLPELKDSDSFVGHLEGFDVIYHLACVNQMRATQHARLNLQVNAYGARMMAMAAERMGARFVYTSTASVYGNACVIPTPVDAKLKPLTDYAVAKLSGEFFVKNSGADYTILRLSNVYGPHQTLDNPYCGVIGRFIQQALDGKPLTIIGDGLQTRDFTFVGDVVHVLYRVGVEGTSRGVNGRVFNVSSGVETTILDLAGLIARTTSNKASIEFIGERPIDGVKRRCLVPDFRCWTPLESNSFATFGPGGIEQTLEWWLNERNVREADSARA